MPMEFIIPSLCIIMVTKLTDSNAVEQRLEKLLQLEEDMLMASFHQNM